MNQTSSAVHPAFDLTDAFFKRQEKLCADLGLADIASHPGTKGDDTELNWQGMLRALLPGRYGVAEAFVIDAHGGLSQQIDIVIHDRHFSPLLFEVGNAKYIPAESVYAAFEVRQSLDKGNLEYAAEKLASVRCLHRTTAPVPHAGGVYEPVQPKRVIGGILTRRSDWNPPFGEAFEDCVRALDDDSGLDIGCAAEHGGFVVIHDEKMQAAGVEHSEANVALIFFVMQLLRKLQVVGSAPAIDYDEYLSTLPGTP